MTNSISAFNNALHKANQWLKELKEIGKFETEEQAYTVLRSVLHALRDRLAPDEAVEFGAEMPMLIRGLYFEGFDLSHPKPGRSSRGFFIHVENEMRNASYKIYAKDGAKAVIKLLQKRISDGELSDVLCSLPEKLRDIVTDLSLED